MKEMHCLQLLLLFFYMYDYSEGNDLDWNIVNKITDYGQNITLFCKINNCCQRNSGWDIFDPNRRTLWIDVRDVSVDSKAKYAPFTNEDGFGLIIRNVTKDDFGIRYGCAYGFDEGDPKMLTENLAFKGPEWIVLKKVAHYGQHLTLFCQMKDCCTEVFEWTVYKSKQEEIHINNSYMLPKKYSVGHTEDGFSLTIMHLAEKDLNISYACRYGKRLGDSKLLSEDDAFDNDIERKAKDTTTLAIIIDTSVLLMLLITILVIRKLVVLMEKRRERKYLNGNVYIKPKEICMDTFWDKSTVQMRKSLELTDDDI